MKSKKTKQEKQEQENNGSERVVRVKRPWRKRLGEVAVVAVKRNPGNGHIVNQEWWDYPEFRELVKRSVRGGVVRKPIEAYVLKWMPAWRRWLFRVVGGRPHSVVFQDTDPFRVVEYLDEEVYDRLEEDRN